MHAITAKGSTGRHARDEDQAGPGNPPHVRPAGVPFDHRRGVGSLRPAERPVGSFLGSTITGALLQGSSATTRTPLTAPIEPAPKQFVRVEERFGHANRGEVIPWVRRRITCKEIGHRSLTCREPLAPAITVRVGSTNAPPSRADSPSSSHFLLWSRECHPA